MTSILVTELVSGEAGEGQSAANILDALQKAQWPSGVGN